MKTQRSLILTLIAAFLVCATIAPAETILFGSRIPTFEILDIASNGTATTVQTSEWAQIKFDGKTSGVARIIFDRTGTRNALKATFSLHPNPASEIGLLSTNLFFDGNDLSYLRPFAVSRFGHRAGVPTPRVGHALVKLHSRPQQLYTVIDRSWAWTKNTNHFATTRSPSDLDPLSLLADPRASNVVSKLAAAKQESDPNVRFEKVIEHLATPDIYHFLATEIVSADLQGYFFTGKARTISINPNGNQLRFYGGLHECFAATPLPILTSGRGIASMIMESTNGRRLVLETVRDLANGRIEQDVRNDIQNRASLLKPLIDSEIELGRLAFALRSVERQIEKRLTHVRQQLRSIPDLTVTQRELPTVKIDFGKGNGAPIKNSNDYGAQFTALVKRDLPIAGSIPVRVIDANITADPRQIAALSRKSTNWIPVTLALDGKTNISATLRLKGHATRQTFAGKPSFTIKFRDGDSSALRSNSKVHFQNAVYDSSYLNQYIGAWLFKKAGLPVAEVNFAKVSINGTPYGLFVLSEGITKTFLAREFGDGDGLLFEGEKGDLDSSLDLDSGETTGDGAFPRDVFAACQQTLQTHDLKYLELYADIKACATFVAAEIALGHIDGYSFRKRNYRVYQALPRGLLQFIPHGMDALSFDIDEGIIPLQSAKGIVAQALLTCPAGRKAYLQAADALIHHTLDLDTLVSDAAYASRLIQPILRTFDVEMARQQLETASVNLRNLGDRKAFLSHELQQRNWLTARPDQN